MLAGFDSTLVERLTKEAKRESTVSKRSRRVPLPISLPDLVCWSAQLCSEHEARGRERYFLLFLQVLKAKATLESLGSAIKCLKSPQGSVWSRFNSSLWAQDYSRHWFCDYLSQPWYPIANIRPGSKIGAWCPFLAFKAWQHRSSQAKLMSCQPATSCLAPRDTELFGPTNTQHIKILGLLQNKVVVGAALSSVHIVSSVTHSAPCGNLAEVLEERALHISSKGLNLLRPRSQSFSRTNSHLLGFYNQLSFRCLLFIFVACDAVLHEESNLWLGPTCHACQCSVRVPDWTLTEVSSGRGQLGREGTWDCPRNAIKSRFSLMY